MLDVFLHGQRVGTLIREPSTQIISLFLEEPYMADANRPVLGQQFEDRREHRVFRQAARPGRLPTFFAARATEGDRTFDEPPVASSSIGPDGLRFWALGVASVALLAESRVRIIAGAARACAAPGGPPPHQ
jgi:serine/threonine-protein kinase HipA